MEILHTKDDVRTRVASWKATGRSVALVPTMGALHEGHLSLVRLARRHADRVIVSIFVNPTQFGPGEDFGRYPRMEKDDLDRCTAASVDAVFLPSVTELYPVGGTVVVDEQELSSRLCGAMRPGHFRGVLTVVAKLFHIVQPAVAVFGQKDAQQLVLIERMVRDLDFPVRIVPAPIVREPDGLALSSRNRYLSQDARRHALCLHKALNRAEAAFRENRRDAEALTRELREILGAEPDVVIEYVALVDRLRLEPVEELRPGTLVALAVRIGSTRLIDNMVLGA